MTERLTLGKVYLQDTERLEQLRGILTDLKERYSLSYGELMKLIQKRTAYIAVPASVFSSSLSPLEALVSYLFTTLQLTQTEIATLLKRDHTTIWTTLINASKKKIAQRGETYTEALIPLNVFSDRTLSILESLCMHLKDSLGMNYHEIASLLGRDDRTVWTVVNRAKKKIKD